MEIGVKGNNCVEASLWRVGLKKKKKKKKKKKFFFSPITS